MTLRETLFVGLLVLAALGAPRLARREPEPAWGWSVTGPRDQALFVRPAVGFVTLTGTSTLVQGLSLGGASGTCVIASGVWSR